MVASKVTASHLARTAYLYVRQSTLRQVVSNSESTQRQYALRQRAVALGWPAEQIVVIDQDQDKSGASAADREGFQRLVGEVGVGRAGIVLGLEVSRLARNNADWHRLLEICALTETLILDEDGFYDPGDFNDRLLLGLKGTMSEAELHFIRARLRGGQLSKARRGELPMALPVGLVYDPAGKVTLDPDAGVQHAIRHVFAVFARTGSARAVVHAGNAQAHGTERIAGPAREGAALLQGLVVCGVCGRRMTVRYHLRHRVEIPDYQCIGECIQAGTARCQTIPGAGVDAAIGQLLLDTVTPLALD